MREPGLWSSAWRCDRHGEVLPYRQAVRPAREALDAMIVASKVPWWSPYPSLIGWTVSGFGACGDDRTGTRASAVCFSGPSPLGGPVDLLLVAEEPGVGLGERFAGLDAPDPGAVGDGPAAATVHADGHAAPLWTVQTPYDDRVAMAGEAHGLWLWVVIWPAAASVLLEDHLQLADVREHRVAREALVYGALSPRMATAS